MQAALPGRASDLFGIGQYADGTSIVPFEIGWAEFERDQQWSRKMLRVWDIEPEHHILITTPNFEVPWSGPLIFALEGQGNSYSNAEPYQWDVRRSAMFLRLFPIRAILGLSEPTTTALLANGHRDLLERVETIWARPEAAEPLRAAGLRPALFAIFGPALGLECPERAGAHLDPQEWTLTDGFEGPLLYTAGDRAHRLRDFVIGPGWRVENRPCPCGLPGPRLVPAGR